MEERKGDKNVRREDPTKFRHEFTEFTEFTEAISVINNNGDIRRLMLSSHLTHCPEYTRIYTVFGSVAR